MTPVATGRGLLLSGCRPTPLASYLSAVGVLRLVAQQADPDACGAWTPLGFVLRTRLSQDDMERFLLDDYRPSPVVSPWNGGSGFDKGNKGPVALQRVRDSGLPRLAAYAETIRAAEGVLARAAGAGLTKQQLVQRCRAALPDAALPWLDAAIVLGGERGVEYPPLLGTGGNDGRLDFSVAFMGRLAEVLLLLTGRSAPTWDRSRSWLRGALLAEPSDPLPAETPGQFSPGALGGVGAGPGADEARTNPWQFVLLVEGALAFAAAAARRLGAGSAGRAVIPFTFESTPAGYASSADEDARAELWMPLWGRPATFAEVDRMLSEGRSSWRGRQSRTGLDAARAASTLGVDRGLVGFERYGLLTRNGLATLAVPLGRVQVTERAVPAVRLASALDPWVQRASSARNPPAAVTAALRRMTDAQLALAQTSGPLAAGRALLDVLVATAALERALGRSAGFRSSARLRPAPTLPAGEWVPLLDQPPELWLAAAFASLRDRPRKGVEPHAVDALATLVRPVTGSGSTWLDGPQLLAGRAVPVERLGAVAARREVLRADRPAPAELDYLAQVGSSAWYDLGSPVRLPDAQALVDGAVEESRLLVLVQALALLDWSGDVSPPHAATPPVSIELALLLPFQLGRVVRRSPQAPEIALRPGRGWPRRLLAGDVGGVLGEAALRLRLAGVPSPRPPARQPHDPVRGTRLAALCVLKVSSSSARRLLDQLDPPEPGTSATSATGSRDDAADGHLDEHEESA